MIRILRFSPFRLALVYVSLSVFVLALFAVPLWLAWSVNISTFRTYIQAEDVQRMTETFDREGARGLAAAIQEKTGSIPGDEVVLLADPSKKRLAGNLPAWPREFPDTPGTHGLVLDLGDSSMRVVASHVILPGGYHLLVGRESARFQSLVDLFWYGIAGAMAIAILLGAAVGRLIRRGLLAEVQEISGTASAIAQGDLSRRVAARSGPGALDALARTVNAMLERLAAQNAQLEQEVTVRRQTEQALQRAHEDLEQVVAQRTAQLARVNESLEQSFRETQAVKEQFQLAIDTIPGLVWSALPDGNVDFLNKRWREYTALTLEEATGWGWQSAIHPEDIAPLLDYWKSVLASGKPGETVARLRRFDGEYRWFLFRGVPLTDGSGRVLKWYGTTTDIEDRTRAETLLADEKQLLEMVARGTSLPVTLEELCRRVERAFNGSMCSIVLLDARGERLSHCAAPSLPQSYTAAVGGWSLASGPCGLAAATGRSVIAADLASEERWESYRALAAAHGLRACWSTPIISSSGKVLGTFAILSHEPGVPTPQHNSTIDQVTHIAAIAIERTRAEEELQRQKTQLDELFDLAPDAIVLTALTEPRNLRINREFTRMFGYAPEEAVGRRLRDLIAPDEVMPIGLTGNTELLDGKRVEREVVRQRKDGTRFHAHVTAKRVRLGDDDDAAYIIYRDITERKTAEDRLKRSEAFLAEGQRISHTGSWGWCLSTGEVVWSDEQYRILGFDPGAVKPSVASFLDVVHPDDRPRVRQDLDVATNERRSYAMEYRVVLPDGATRHLRSVGRPVVGEAGNVEEYIGVTTDITERVQTESALKRSEERHALAMRAAGEGHWDWNIATDEFYGSPRMLEMYGLPAGTIFAGRGDFLARFPFHPEDRPKWERAAAAHFAGNTARFDIEIRMIPRGEVRWIHLTGLLQRDDEGRPVRWTGSVADVTGRKHVEEELRARQEMLDLAQKAARAVAFEWRVGAADAQNRWSPDLEAMYGLAPGSYDGSFDAWQKLVHPEDWPAVREAIQRANESGEVAAEYRVAHADGTTHWLQAKGRMLFDEEGQPTRMVGFVLDVTDRRHAEDELRRLERRLRQAQRLEAMGTLAGGIAHDFNNILGAILGYGEMALRDAPKGSRLRRDVESILTAGERGRTLVDRVLTFSRSGVAERVPVHVEGVVREGLELLAAKLPEGIAIETALQADRAAMLGEPTQVHQVLMNLAMNAIQAMPAGGILGVSLKTLRVETARVATIGTIEPMEYIVLDVADTGTGIAPDILDRIFDPFFTTKEVNVGTGLGLSLVHGIVMEMGGAVDVASTVGSGSVFTVYLPRSGHAPADLESSSEAVPQGNGERILVVDDEEPLVRLATESLQDFGYAPAGFTSSSAALEAFRANPRGFDAVVTDERMPGMSGAALIRQLRGIRRSVPIVLVSGYVGGLVASRAYNEGATEVLKKPLSPRELALSLARVLHRN